MTKTRAKVIVVVFLVSLLGVGGTLSCRQPPSVQIPNSRWVPIFFKEIDRVTNLAELPELKKVHVNQGDVEVRFWHGFSLAPLEGVIVKRTNGHWSAVHLNANNYFEPQSEDVVVTELKPPKSGWEAFWRSLVDKGLLTLPDYSEINCEGDGFDSLDYVVEINQDNSYRTYMYRGAGKCREARQMEDIDQTIGLEFDSGEEECKRMEWFPCATLVQSRRQSSER